MVNEQIVRRLLNNINSYIKDLEDISDISIEEYATDIKTQRYVERTLHITIEAMLDAAHHIISDENYREPDSYADTFTILTEHEILSPDMLQKAKLMAQFRNKLVHYYEKIDTDQIFDILKNHTSDFSEFVDAINSFLRTPK